MTSQRAADTADGTGLTYAGLTGRLQSANDQGMRWRLLFSAIWLLYLISPISHMFRAHRGALEISGALALVVVFSAIYILMMSAWATRPRQARWSLPVLYAMAAVACVVYGGNGWNVLWIYVAAAGGLTATDRRTAIRSVLASGAGVVVFSWIGHDSATDYLVTLLPVIAIGLATSGMRVRVALTHELIQAREEVARLAANEERLRLARDMHDLTGQSLSMITLKSELAVKLLDNGDNSKTREQLEEVAAISRQTLHDIREAVSGYRRPTLAVELITARTALTAAGIETRDDPALITLSGTFDADAEAALAWCLREAVTNVIRHSGASSCSIELIHAQKELTLTVSDDGRGGSKLGSGNGLRGMSERLDAAGGRLRMTRAPGFTLSATVPARRVTVSQ